MSGADVSPVGVGVVGVRPGQAEGILADLPCGDLFRLVAFSDEYLDGPRPEERPVTYYPDYHLLLQDPDVELVLIDGPPADRRDAAVRALNAGRHVVLAPPFGESAADGERILKTARRAGLLATMPLPWRDEPDLAAALAALGSLPAAPLHGILAAWSVADFPEAGPDAIEAAGLRVLDQLNLLARADVASVAAHVVTGRADAMLYLPLRGGAWIVAHLARIQPPGTPRFVIARPDATIAVAGGSAAVHSPEGLTAVRAPAPVDFWANLHAAVRGAAEPKCHPVDIVRAMKLHEAALASARDGEPASV